MAHESSQRSHRLHRVAVVVDENSNPFELGCVTEVFGLHRPEVGGFLYDLQICAPSPRTVMRDSFFIMTGVANLSAVDDADTVIVPNRPDTDTPRRRAVLDLIRRAHERGARLIGMCSGAFTLAEAGVLDGRRATAHWQWADSFRSRFPSVQFEVDVLFVDDGDILTAAGSAAALDLGLHVVRRDHGAVVANTVSRRLVFTAHRDGGQRQFIDQPVPAAVDDSLAPLLEWAATRLGSGLSVGALAAHAGLSRATLHRRFQSQLGTTPLAWMTVERIALACRMLESSNQPIDAVARASGLGTASNMRAAMREATGLTPSAYRQRFAHERAPQGRESASPIL